MTDAKKIITLEEFLALPLAERGERAEFIDGQVVQKTLPGGRHAKVEGGVFRTVSNIFLRKKRSDGTGGWWILSEASVLYRAVRAQHTHDIVGWRRDRVVTEPLDYPILERPDWVCEIAFSTMKKDTRDIKRTLEIEEVPFYWVLDVANEHLLVFERIDGHLVQTRDHFREDGKQRIPPFDAVEISMGLLLGDDPDEHE